MAAPALPPPPIESPLLGTDGKVTPAWARWFRQLWEYVR